MSEQSLRMISGSSRLMYCGTAFSKHTSQQNGTFNLSTCHGQGVGNRLHLTTMNAQWRTSGFYATRLNLRSHLCQWLHNAPHWTAAQGSVSKHLRIERTCCQHSCQKPHTCTGITAINGVSRWRRAHGYTRDAESDRTVSGSFFQYFHPGTQLFHGSQGI